MKKDPRSSRFVLLALVAMLALVGLLPALALADQRVTLNSGLTLQGLLAEIASLNQNPFQAGGQGEIKTRPILLVDDGLRRVYVHRRGMVVGEPQDVRGVEKTIEFKQSVPLGGTDVQSIGDILGVSPFNRYGRRFIQVRGPSGSPISIIQGITELTSRYAKVEALTQRPPYQWDMRVATSTIPSEELLPIFRQRLDQDNFDRRLEIVRFFIEAGRFQEAELELKRTIRDFPDMQDMTDQVIGIVSQQASQLIDEAKQRASVGQEQFARDVYGRFPLDAVGVTLRLTVSDELRRLDEDRKQIADLVSSIRADVGKLPDGGAAFGGILNEIQAGLSPATRSRLNDYIRLQKADNIPLENRVALAVGGWLLGQDAGEQNLIVAQSLIEVRDLVAEYLGSNDPGRRRAIIEQLQMLEGSQIENVARILPLIKPPKAWPQGSEDANIAGFFRIEPSGDGPRYMVQLPPEYDPLREYPCIVAVPPPNANPETELTWWAGSYDEVQKARSGHAMRNGYIVVVPNWSRPGQRTYEYTPREHVAVLSALRHAMRRASIDSDRVFLVGHGEGATAAWDIALSHPDHWAGMISINGEPSKTIQHYFPNARNVPLYFVMGESSGPTPPLVRMGPVLDDYMHVRNDATVVMYRGRGSEHFFEELPELFRWMNATTHVRRETPTELEAVTMRAGDQHFWWLELGPLKPAINLNPVLWDQEKRKRSGKISGTVGQGNRIFVSGPADTFTLWLRPDMGIDLSQTVLVPHGSRRLRFDFDGGLETILEDVRTRADRKRPFWAKMQIP